MAWVGKFNQCRRSPRLLQFAFCCQDLTRSIRKPTQVWNNVQRLRGWRQRRRAQVFITLKVAAWQYCARQVQSQPSGTPKRQRSPRKCLAVANYENTAHKKASKWRKHSRRSVITGSGMEITTWKLHSFTVRLYDSCAKYSFDLWKSVSSLFSSAYKRINPFLYTHLEKGNEAFQAVSIRRETEIGRKKGREKKSEKVLNCGKI